MTEPKNRTTRCNFIMRCFWHLFWSASLAGPTLADMPKEPYPGLCLVDMGDPRSITLPTPPHSTPDIEVTVDGSPILVNLERGKVRAWTAKDPQNLPVIWTTKIKDKLTDWAISPRGYFWARGGEAQYRGQLSLADEQLTIRIEKIIPTIYALPCTLLNRWSWDEGCPLAKPFYSKALDRGFFKGYEASTFTRSIAVLESPPKLWEPHRVHRDILKIIGDTPSINGALMVGGHGKPIFYDGTQKISIFPFYWYATPNGSDGGGGHGWAGLECQGASKVIVYTLKRNILPNLPMLFAIDKKHEITKITPPDSQPWYWNCFSISNNMPMMAFANEGVYMEQNGKLRQFITPPSGFHFEDAGFYGLDTPNAKHFLLTRGRDQRIYRLERKPSGLVACK